MLGSINGGELVTIVTVIATTSLGVIAALVRVGTSLGRVAQTLEDLARRVDRLESATWPTRGTT